MHQIADERSQSALSEGHLPGHSLGGFVSSPPCLINYSSGPPASLKSPNPRKVGEGESPAWRSFQGRMPRARSCGDIRPLVSRPHLVSSPLGHVQLQQRPLIPNICLTVRTLRRRGNARIQPWVRADAPLRLSPFPGPHTSNHLSVGSSIHFVSYVFRHTSAPKAVPWALPTRTQCSLSQTLPFKLSKV